MKNNFRCSLNLLLSKIGEINLIVILLALCLALNNIALAEVPESLFLTQPPSVELTSAARILIAMETRYNSVATRSNRPFHIEHLEIPLSVLTEDKALSLDPKIYRSMVFKKNGVDHVRWILNPEDTTYGDELQRSLEEKGISATRGRHFIGYLTASRSCLVQDPTSGVIFSFKASTNVTAGAWRDKKETARAAKAARLVTDYVQTTFDPNENKTLNFIPEPLSFSFEGADQAIVVRQYDALNQSGKNGTFLVPLFSLMHDFMGPRLAKKNGSNDPTKFWAQNAIEPLTRAVVEFMMNFGLSYNSPHGQNLLVEVDANFKPTGKIFFRDFADTHLQVDILNRRGGEEILKHYSESQTGNNELLRGTLMMAIGPYHVGEADQGRPRYLSHASFWQNAFTETVFKTISVMTTGSSQNAGNIGQNWDRAQYGNTWILTSGDVSQRHWFVEWISQLLPKRPLSNPLPNAAGLRGVKSCKEIFTLPR